MERPAPTSRTFANLSATALCAGRKQQIAWLEAGNITVNATAYALLRAGPWLDFAPWPTDPTASSVQNEVNPPTCLPPASSASAAKIPEKISDANENRAGFEKEFCALWSHASPWLALGNLTIY